MSNEISIDINTLQAAIAAGANRDLGTVVLRIETSQSNETSQPVLPDQVPTVMSDFAAVPSDNYKFLYSDTRFTRLHYILERGVAWEYGELLVLSLASYDSSNQQNEMVLPSVPSEATLPSLMFSHNVIMTSSSRLGVDLSAIPYASSPATFGVAYMITNASPSVFPAIRMSVATEFPVFDQKIYG